MGTKGLSRYSELNNRDWLYDKYITQKLTTTAISDLVQCSHITVCDALVRHGISVRHGAPPKISQIPELNNYVWLFNRYCTNKENPTTIASILGTQKSVVQAALVRLGIPRRTRNDAVKLWHGKNDTLSLDSSSAYSIFIGSQLGDGYLRRTNKGGYVGFEKRNLHYNHVAYVAKSIFGETYSNRLSIHKAKFRVLKDGTTRPARTYHQLSSLYSESLIEEYNRWYVPTGNRNRHVKVVPKDLELNSEIVLHWFLDDGSSSWAKNSDLVRIRLHSQGFSKKENEFLTSLFFKHEICANVVKSGKHYEISIPSSYAIKFFEFIGPCPKEISELAYKWKIPSRQILPQFRYKLLEDKQWLTDNYNNCGKNQSYIASLFGCHHTTVRYWLLKHGILI